MREPKKGLLVTVTLNGSTFTFPVARVEKDDSGRWVRVYGEGMTYPYHRHEVSSVCRPSR
jgi:FtsP/CotA-like multicopper oxidase with cupredoxin domain